MKNYNKKWIKTALPCPCGKSSDAYSVDVDGNGFCFRGDCNKYFKNSDKNNNDGDMYLSTEENSILKLDKFDYYPHRGISRRTFEFYDVKTGFHDGKPIECGFVFANKAIQIKKIDPDWTGNKYRVEGPYGEAGLFGKDRFDPGSKESITISEGLHDSLAVFEMTNGNTAACSVKSSSTAKTDCIKDWEYINSFKKIILCFDNDEPGRHALRNVASLFDFNKVYQVKFHKRKDPNEYLINQETQEFLGAWKSARRFAPDNIISSFAEIEQALKQDTESQIATYPFKALNERLYGIHEGEVVVVKAQEGVGKTEFFRAIEHHVLKTTNHPIGIIHLEEDNGTTVKAIAGYELEVPAVLPDCGLSDEEILKAYKRAVKDDEGRVHIYASFDQEDEQQFLDNMRFLVSAAGCKIIFWDHISWLATGKDDDDERKKLDRLSQKAKLLAKELRFAIIVISHVNDDGKTRGSRNISKAANTVISLDRDKISLDPIVRNTTQFLIDKARLGGRTGPAGSAIMDQEKGKLIDTNSEMVH